MVRADAHAVQRYGIGEEDTMSIRRPVTGGALSLLVGSAIVAQLPAATAAASAKVDHFTAIKQSMAQRAAATPSCRRLAWCRPSRCWYSSLWN
jgi:hypothetical protein